MVDSRIYQDKNVKRAVTEGPLRINRKVKSNNFVSNAMRVKQKMLNGLLNDLEKSVIEESIERFKKERGGQERSKGVVKGGLLLNR